MINILPKDIDLSMSITTCNRPELFVITMASFFRVCGDTNFIKRIYIIDDNSPENDREMMISVLKTAKEKRGLDFKIIPVFRNNNKGHYYSIKEIFDVVDTKYLFAIEDDWLFGKEGCFLSDALTILFNTDLDYIGLRKFVTHGYHETEVIKFENYPTYHYRLNTEYSNWPGFSFNPHIVNFEWLKSNVGTPENIPDFERNYAIKCKNKGIRLGFLDKDYVKHIGVIPAYTINGTCR